MTLKDLQSLKPADYAVKARIEIYPGVYRSTLFIYNPEKHCNIPEEAEILKYAKLKKWHNVRSFIS